MSLFYSIWICEYNHILLQPLLTNIYSRLYGANRKPTLEVFLELLRVSIEWYNEKL